MTLLASWIGRDRALVAADTRMTPLELAPDSAMGQRLAHEQAAAGSPPSRARSCSRCPTPAWYWRTAARAPSSAPSS